MNASMKPNLIHVLVLFLLSVFPSHSAFADPIVTIDPSSLNVPAGQTFSVDVSISNVTDLFAFQFDLGFNPAIIAADGVTEGSFLATGGSTFFIAGTIDNVGGSVSSNADTLLTALSGVSGSGTLATFELTAVGAGSSSLDV